MPGIFWQLLHCQNDQPSPPQLAPGRIGRAAAQSSARSTTFAPRPRRRANLRASSSRKPGERRRLASGRCGRRPGPSHVCTQEPEARGTERPPIGTQHRARAEELSLEAGVATERESWAFAVALATTAGRVETSSQAIHVVRPEARTSTGQNQPSPREGEVGEGRLPLGGLGEDRDRFQSSSDRDPVDLALPVGDVNLLEPACSGCTSAPGPVSEHGGREEDDESAAIRPLRSARRRLA